MLEAGRTLLVGPTFDAKFGPDALKIPKLLDDPDVETEMAGAEEALARGVHTGLWGQIGERSEERRVRKECRSRWSPDQ